MKKLLILSLLLITSLSAGAAQEIQIETGYFLADSTGTESVDTGFTPDYVEFTANQKINSINRDHGSNPNSNCPQNVNGWSEGTAVFDDSGNLEKQVTVGSSRNSYNTNTHRTASSTSDVIKDVYNSRNGAECGKLEITMNQQLNDGFEVDVQNKYNQWDEVVIYRAYNFPSDVEYDAGLEKITSTGQKDVTEPGFEPYYIDIRNGHLIDEYNMNENQGGDYFGKSDGYGVIKDDGSTEQYSLGFGTNSHSTNAHNSYSSDSRIIRNIYSGEGGSNNGQTTASLESGLSNGFRLSVNNNYRNEVFMYRAFEGGNYQVDIGHKSIDSTGTKTFDFGFTPDHIGLHSSQRVGNMGGLYSSPSNSGCSNTYGWMDGWMDVGEDQYAIGTARSSGSMNADRVHASNSQLLMNIYSDNNGNVCGRLEGSVTSTVDGQGVEMDVTNQYVTETLIYNAFDLTVVTSDPEFDGDRYVADDTEKGDGATIYTGSPEFGIDVNHPDNVDTTVEFIAGDGSTFATDYVSSDGEATATWSGLQNGETYEWTVEACDNYGNCATTSEWSFTVDYNDEIGRRDDDYHPQGANVSQNNPLYSGYIDRIMDNSSQLEPGMKSTFYDMSDSTADPDKYHRDYAFIADAEEAKWFDSQGTTDRSDRWSISDDVSESIGNTGQSYEPGGTYYHPGYSGTIRTEANDETIPKPAKVFANSFAAIATTELEDDSSSIQEGFGVWIEPDNIKKYNEYYRNSWEQKVQFNIDLTGPDAGIGFESDSYGAVSLGDYEYRYNGDKEVIGDIYWQNEYQGQDQVPGELQKSMCGDDGTEYLVEEIGEINNSRRYAGNYACATTNDVCYHSKVSGRKLFSTGEYLDTGDETEYKGRAKNDHESCRQFDWDQGRFSGIQADLFPGWYDQDFRERYCRENTLFGTEGVRWFGSNYVDENPHAVTGGIDDDWNSYIADKIGSVSSIAPYTSQPEQESWVGMQSPLPTGTNGDDIATLGFCGGDDSAEYIVTQDCVTSSCSTNRDVMGVSKDPDNCVADGEVISSNEADVNSVDYEDDDGNWQDMEGSDARRIVPEGRSIRFDYGGDTSELTCYAGSFLEDWPVIFQEETASVPYGESSTVTFRLVNPDQQEVTYDVEMTTTTDSSVSGAGLDSFTSVVDQQGQTTFTTEVAGRSADTYQVEIRGGNEGIDDPNDNYVTIYAESADSRITGSDSVGVEVVETEATEAGQQGTSPDEIPGIMPVQMLIMVLASAAAVFFMA